MSRKKGPPGEDPGGGKDLRPYTKEQILERLLQEVRASEQEPDDLQDRLRSWLWAGPSESDVFTLHRQEVRELLSAMEAAKKFRGAARELRKLQAEHENAEAAARAAGSKKAAAYGRAMGASRLSKYPDTLTDHYLFLTRSTGIPVLSIVDSSSIEAGKPSSVLLPHPTPLTPDEAVEAIAESWGLPRERCRKALQRQRNQRRQAGQLADYPLPRGRDRPL